VREIAWRFVAGETLEDALATARRLSLHGMKATLSYVGTHVRDVQEAQTAASMGVATLLALAATSLEPNISIKLTQLGLDIGEAFCLSQIDRILAAAASVGGFVRVDMEEAVYVPATIRIFDAAFARYGPAHVGIVHQSYLRGNSPEMERHLREGASIRIVKGGYWESADLVLRAAPDIDAAFHRDIERLVVDGYHPAIASHDAAAVEHAIRVAAAVGRPASEIEFQTLLGVRADLSERLVDRGLSVRCYVPFGGQWYDYVLGCLRRLPGTAVSRVRDRLVGT
jgi:proline dehydrogenase